MNNLPKAAIPAVLGLIIGAAVAAFLGYRFSDSAAQAQTGQVLNRQASIHAMALVDLVGGQQAGESRDDAAVLQTLATEWVNANEDVVSARILRTSGARLLASTLAEDLSGELPRRLAREEKPFFDLAQELRAGIDTNRDEGVFRKEEVARTLLENGHLQVTAPYVVNGRVQGVVQLEVQPKFIRAELSALPTWMLFFLPLALFVLIAWILARGEAADRSKWVYFALSTVLLLAGLIWFTNRQTTAFKDYRTGIENQIGQHLTNVRGQAEQQALGMGMTLSISENLWDSDAFRRPLGYVRADGSLNEANIEESLSASVRPLRNTLWGNALLAVLLLSFFALGFAGRLWRTMVEHRTAYSYITPALIGMVILVFFPFFYGLALSFTGQTLYNTDQPLTEIWVGFENYADILFDFSLRVTTETGERVWNYENFYWTLFITICWTVGNVAIGLTVGLALALCLNTKTLMGKPIYRAILILPWAIPNYVTSLIWKGLFHKQFGPINQIIQMFGGEPVAWFDNVFTSFLTGLTVNGWLSFPFMMVISLGALQSISQEMYEAARLDGASRFQQFRFITLPSLKPALIPAIIISVVWTFNMFNIIYLVSAGEPAGANEILVTKAYKIAFEKYQYGYAAAYATVIFFILLVYGIFQTKMTHATEDISR